MTARDLITASLKELGVLAGTETPTADQASDAMDRLNLLVESFTIDRLTITEIKVSTHALVPYVQTYTIGPGGDWSVPRPVWIERWSLVDQSVDPEQETQYGHALTPDEWAAIGIKTLQSTQPTELYFDYAYDASGRGNITVWPVPTQTALAIRLYIPTPISGNLNLNTDLFLPPGYTRMLITNLAVELAPQFGVEPNPLTMKAAMESTALVKNANVRHLPLPLDPALAARPSYNWRSDTTGRER